jgi:hypothetical protein
VLSGLIRFGAAMAGAVLPYRLWTRLPPSWPVEAAAVASGVASVFAGCAIGIPGFLEHAWGNASLANGTMLRYDFWSRGMASGFSGVSIFSFLLLTPKGWATSYLVISGTVRALAAWFEDPMGDPILTAVDAVVYGRRAANAERQARDERLEREGPELPDRVVSSSAAGIPGCDLVIVSSRRKPGWERGTAVFTRDKVYRLGEPVEQTIAGRLRYLYPLTEHADFEAIRRSVQYDLPQFSDPAAVKELRRSSGDQETRNSRIRS